MRKLIGIIVLFLSAVALSLPAGAETRFGIQCGVDIANLNKNDIPGILDRENQTGFSAALGFEYINEFGLGFDFFAKYLHRNNAFDYRNSFDNRLDQLFNDENYRKQDIIQVPVNIKFRLNLWPFTSVIAPYVTTGPTFSYRISEDTGYEGIKENRFSAAWGVGGGVMLFKHLQIGVNHSWNFTDNVRVIFSDQSITLKNRGWEVTGTVFF